MLFRSRQQWQQISAASYGNVVSRHYLSEYRRPVDAVPREEHEQLRQQLAEAQSLLSEAASGGQQVNTELAELRAQVDKLQEWNLHLLKLGRPKPHWRTPDELPAHAGLRDGDRIVAVAQWPDHVCTDTEDWPESITKAMKPHLLVLRITDESPGAVDTELQDYTQHDCERWMPESEFLQLLNDLEGGDRKSTRLNSSHSQQSRMPSSA